MEGGREGGGDEYEWPRWNSKYKKSQTIFITKKSTDVKTKEAKSR